MRLIEADDAVRLEPDQPAQAAVILLHGLGADGHDFVPVAEALGLPQSGRLRFVFPHAPVRRITLNGGMRMRGWYDIYSLERNGRQDQEGIAQAAAIAQSFIDEQVGAGVPRQRIVLAGFSQGGAVALHAGLRQEQALAGILALSTYLPLRASLPAELTPAGRSTPVLQCHGRFDSVLPVAMGSEARDFLRSIGCEVQWHDYPMDHEVCAEEIADMGAWLAPRLD
ncbi:MAG: alpha/beta fold hydrolase [Nevskia sp.]|nr:alpha/beta fold hydrolase [Nevskia sp.]